MPRQTANHQLALSRATAHMHVNAHMPIHICLCRSLPDRRCPAAVPSKGVLTPRPLACRRCLTRTKQRILPEASPMQSRAPNMCCHHAGPRSSTWLTAITRQACRSDQHQSSGRPWQRLAGPAVHYPLPLPPLLPAVHHCPGEGRMRGCAHMRTQNDAPFLAASTNGWRATS